MSELHKFLFDGLPVRGVIVRLTDVWQEILARRASNTVTGAYAPPVSQLLGEMTAAAALMQASIQFNGALILQIFGDGPLKLAVAEARSDMGLRATASVNGALCDDMPLQQMVNLRFKGRCAITLDPLQRQHGQQPYQGVVPLVDERGQRFENLSVVLQHYMRQSEQLDSTFVLAADDRIAAGLLIQRLPIAGAANLQGRLPGLDPEEDYRRISILAASLTRKELLTLDIETILRRLFWEEKLQRLALGPATGSAQALARPHMFCVCSRERVAGMIRALGRAEAESILAERGEIEVGCDFCGQQYRFDAVDATRLFTAPVEQPPGSATVQ
ncbi:MAG: Hsp33 family molecular chaperone HslO [Burkholderiaceae bacterium]|jgi:molecular chaperone Hsp33|nr:Hsp33 family molecular chaperone HslO [Burkholderiaceae bacterium]